MPNNDVTGLVMEAEQAAGRGEIATAIDLYQKAKEIAPPESMANIDLRLKELWGELKRIERTGGLAPTAPPISKASGEIPSGGKQEDISTYRPRKFSPWWIGGIGGLLLIILFWSFTQANFPTFDDTPPASETPTVSILSSPTPADSSAITSTDMATNTLTVLLSPTPSESPTFTPNYIPQTITDTPKPTRTKKPLPPPPTNTPDVDVSPPSISNPRKVGAIVSCMVTFEATVTDETEVVQVELYWGKNSPPSGSDFVYMNLHSGSTTNGVWRGTFSVAGFIITDQLRVYVRAYDWFASNQISNTW